MSWVGFTRRNRSPKLTRAVPYWVYDITNNVGWVSVGTDHDTASFAVHAIRRWGRTMGRKRHPVATRLLISAGSPLATRLGHLDYSYEAILCFRATQLDRP
jgi:hypothetical protein